MNDKLNAMVLASFAGDALALGAHWVYNTGVIDKKFGRVETFQDPITSYHKGKHKGDFTHYGDQALVLLESVMEKGSLDLGDFARRWQTFFSSYTGYFDKATKATLENLAQGQGIEDCGSASDDLAGASRIAPLFCVYGQSPDALVASARVQTAFTHNHPAVIDAAEFFARTAMLVLEKTSPTEAMERSLEIMDAGDGLKEAFRAGKASRMDDTRQTITDFGQMCEIHAALPGTVHLIAKYETDLCAALVENVMAGGDSAARGMIAGMVIGANLGTEAIPRPWLEAMMAYPRIVKLLSKVE